MTIETNERRTHVTRLGSRDETRTTLILCEAPDVPATLSVAGGAVLQVLRLLLLLLLLPLCVSL